MPLTVPQDLSAFDKVIEAQELGLDVPILHMDGKTPLGWSIRVSGPDSDRTRNARAKLQEEVVARQSVEPLTFDERQEQSCRFLSRTSIGISAEKLHPMLDGKPVETSEAGFYALYKRFSFIREQVEMRGVRREDFLEVLSPPSPTQSDDGQEESQHE